MISNALLATVGAGTVATAVGFEVGRRFTDPVVDSSPMSLTSTELVIGAGTAFFGAGVGYVIAGCGSDVIGSVEALSRTSLGRIARMPGDVFGRAGMVVGGALLGAAAIGSSIKAA